MYLCFICVLVVVLKGQCASNKPPFELIMYLHLVGAHITASRKIAYCADFNAFSSKNSVLWISCSDQTVLFVAVKLSFWCYSFWLCMQQHPYLSIKLSVCILCSLKHTQQFPYISGFQSPGCSYKGSAIQCYSGEVANMYNCIPPKYLRSTLVAPAR